MAGVAIAFGAFCIAVSFYLALAFRSGGGTDGILFGMMSLPFIFLASVCQ
jgi:hypothetical protein